MIERRPVLTFLTHTVLIFGVLAICFPLWMALVASTHDGSRLSQDPLPLWFGDQGLATYTKLMTEGAAGAGTASVGRMLLNSAIMAVGITAGKIAISLTAAYAIVFFRFPFRMISFWLIFVTLMLPVEVRILPTFDVAADMLKPVRSLWDVIAGDALFSQWLGYEVRLEIPRLSLLNSYPGLILPLIASATATFLFRQVFLTIPDSLVEAAKMDGAGPWRFFRDILLPMSRTNIAALTIILFIYGWNQYVWPLVVTTDADYTTVVMGIQRMVNSGEALPVWHEIMGTAVLALLPPVIVVLAMQKLFVKGLTEQEK
ncbi:sn-glycerol-3-phosphate ABC transporter permease UgpE [Paralimibaculum aggregatum]|uniref:sn-glycerol-3-phosphate transport system permease protein UgpE n=1 Tax=Paralimibaculum aggregatum TaxID=3036245 RepID=A0ABQ6LCM8_9RHOB|nr:ABC transporter permease subunit [Limibaculum sp. NKW23]GMG81138.1 sn-glycerol-3-phosphate ABC transporter permease UgpE [Limibaculum sp. NKW23]